MRPAAVPVSRFGADGVHRVDVRILAATNRHLGREVEQGNWAAAARDLDMHRSNLHRLAGRLGILQQ